MDGSEATMTSPAGIAPINAARPRAGRRAFTLVELICVMTLLLVVVAMVSPQLSGFFRGRNVDSEVRRFYSLTLHGQQRAISEGTPMLLWVDPDERAYGLQAETTDTGVDPKQLRYDLDEYVGLEVQRSIAPNSRRMGSASGVSGSSSSSLSAAAANRLGTRYGRNAGIIRFQSDGAIDASSLAGVGFFTRDAQGARLASERESTWVAQRFNGLSYEIPTNLPSFQR